MGDFQHARRFPGRDGRHYPATREPEENGGDAVLRGKLVAGDLDVGEPGDVTGNVGAVAAGLIPDWHHDDDIFQRIQRGADMFAVGNARTAGSPNAGHQFVTGRIVRINIGVAVARLREAVYERGFAGIASPRQPAELSRLRTDPDIGQRVSLRRVRDRLIGKRDGINRALPGRAVAGEQGAATKAQGNKSRETIQVS